MVAAEDLEPEFEPGHRYELEGLEAGIWMQVDNIEKRIKTSPHYAGDDELNDYLQTLVCRLAGPYCPDIRVYVLRTPSFNASMYPNGMMIVHTGLLVRVQNEDQLAAVLGHEIGHYLRQHGLKRIRNLKNTASFLSFLTLGLAVAGQYNAAQAAQYGALASIFGFSREQEREADTFGTRLMYEAGYDPREASKVWKNVIEENEAAKYKRHRSLFFETHPGSKERMATLAGYAEEFLAEHEPVPAAEERFDAIVEPRRRGYLEDELNMRRFGPSEVVLDRLEETGIGLGEVLFYKGELYRLRDEDGDREAAMAQYRLALTYDDVPPEVHRSIGMLLLKDKQKEAAIKEFAAYLELVPDATDREMVEMYMGWGG